jgi:uncharacterized protein (TIGR03382 family)
MRGLKEEEVMPAGINSIKSMTAAAFVGATLLAVTGATADTSEIPNLTMSVQSNSGTMAFNPADFGSAWKNANNTFGFSGLNSVANDFSVGWSLLVNPDPFVIANLVVTNNTLVTQTFSLTVSAPTGPIANACIGGSISGSVTDNNGDGATLETAPGTALYQALIDGGTAATLLDDPFSVTTGSFLTAIVGPASFGDPIPSQPYLPGVAASIGITITFTLSAGDSAGFTSIFVVEECIPAPAALALFGVAGLVGSRRRRSISNWVKAGKNKLTEKKGNDNSKRQKQN